MLLFLLIFTIFSAFVRNFPRREMESYYIFTGFSAQILVFERAADGTIESLLYHMFAETQSHQNDRKLCKIRTVTDCLAWPSICFYCGKSLETFWSHLVAANIWIVLLAGSISDKKIVSALQSALFSTKLEEENSTAYFLKMWLVVCSINVG